MLVRNIPVPALSLTVSLVPAACQQYTIGVGDTLATVCNNYHVTLAELLSVNSGLNGSSILSVGEKVRGTDRCPGLLSGLHIRAPMACSIKL